MAKTSVPPNNYIDPLHELEDRLGYLARMLKASREALSSAVDKHEDEEELGRLAALAEELAHKAFAARPGQVVA